jgi:hypothetical protein
VLEENAWLLGCRWISVHQSVSPSKLLAFFLPFFMAALQDSYFLRLQVLIPVIVKTTFAHGSRVLDPVHG